MELWSGWQKQDNKKTKNRTSGRKIMKLLMMNGMIKGIM